MELMRQDQTIWDCFWVQAGQRVICMVLAYQPFMLLYVQQLQCQTVILFQLIQIKFRSSKMKNFSYQDYGFEPYYFYLPQQPCYSLFPQEPPFYLVNLGIQCQQSFSLQNVILNDSCFNSPLTQFCPIAKTALCTDNSLPQEGNAENQLSKTMMTKQIQNRTKCVRVQKTPRSLQGLEKTPNKSNNDRFIKKNTESNVVNQIFSFLWSPQKSRTFLMKLLGQQTKVDIFYQLMRVIKINCKSQLNRHFLKDLMTVTEWENGLRKLKKKVRRIEEIGYQNLSCIIRTLVLLYLRQISRNSILTSKKMNRQLWSLHFRKCDQLRIFLFEESSI